MNSGFRKVYLVPVGICLAVIAGLIYYYFFSSLSARTTTTYIYIDSNDNIDSGTGTHQPYYTLGTYPRQVSR